MVVDASDVKYFFESEGQDRFSCGVEEQIQLQGDSSDDVYWEYKYQTNYDESNSATNGCGDNDVDSSSRRGSIEILRRDSQHKLPLVPHMSCQIWITQPCSHPLQKN